MKKEEMYAFHAEFCKTFTNPKRIEILDLLREDALTVNAIQEEIGKTKAYTYTLLSAMRMINIVKAKRDGTHVYYSIADEKTANAYGAMQDVLEQLMTRTSAVRPIRVRI